jgi:hypothetical protein
MAGPHATGLLRFRIAWPKRRNGRYGQTGDQGRRIVFSPRYVP